jgi:hypothetical protein
MQNTIPARRERKSLPRSGNSTVSIFDVWSLHSVCSRFLFVPLMLIHPLLIEEESRTKVQEIERSLPRTGHSASLVLDVWLLHLPCSSGTGLQIRELL